jgi:hypothetical protein
MDKVMSLNGTASGAKTFANIHSIRSSSSALGQKRIRSIVQFLVIVGGLLGVIVAGAVCGIFLPL